MRVRQSREEIKKQLFKAQNVILTIPPNMLKVGGM